MLTDPSLVEVPHFYIRDTQVSGAAKQAHTQKQHTDTHADNLTGTILERLWIFWKPDVCLCVFVCVYED